MLDNRYFGTVTAYVPGPEAARFHFTSALPVRVTGLLMPPSIVSPPPAASRVRFALRARAARRGLGRRQSRADPSLPPPVVCRGRGST
jgi:hypothetical protein